MIIRLSYHTSAAEKSQDKSCHGLQSTEFCNCFSARNPNWQNASAGSYAKENRVVCDWHEKGIRAGAFGTIYYTTFGFFFQSKFFQYKKCPFGRVSSMGYSQKALSITWARIAKQLNGLSVLFFYADDLLIRSDNLSQHLRDLKLFFRNFFLMVGD